MHKTKPISLHHNFSWTFIGNAIYAASQWGMLVVLAKLGSPQMVGQFTLGLAVTAPIIMFTNLQLRAVQATDAKKLYSFSDYFGLRLIATGLAMTVIAIITFFAGYDRQTAFVILLIGLAKAFESISDVFYGLIQQHERMNLIAISLMIKGPLSLLLLGIGVYLSSNILWGVVGLVSAWAIVLFGCDIRNGTLVLTKTSQLKPRFHNEMLIKLTWLSLPLGFVMMLISLNGNIPRYFIERYLGVRELGIFAALAYLMIAGVMVVSALGESASPRLAKYYAAGEIKAFRVLLYKLVGIATLLGGAGILSALLAGRFILSVLYQAEYAERLDVFIWLMVAAGIGYIGSFLGYAMTATRAFSYSIIPYLSASVIVAICSLLLIPMYGLVGAAWALCAANLASLVIPIFVLIFLCKRIYNSSL